MSGLPPVATVEPTSRFGSFVPNAAIDAAATSNRYRQMEAGDLYTKPPAKEVVSTTG
jgi:hypothetical protein